MRQFDVIIVGAGIVGLATGWSLLKRRPGLKVGILEKERDIAQHQTGHNSGVIHSGIYYKPGSLKATNCLNGYKMLLNFCEENEVPYELCGKVIVATSEAELPVLDNIFKRGESNGLSGLKKISAAEVREIEPHVRCVAGIRVPQTGIVDYKTVAAKYRLLFEQAGGEVFLNEAVKDIFTKNKITTVVGGRQEFLTKLVVNCAGLYSDKISRMTMPDIRLQIVPFRGEYYMLKKEKQQLVRHLIYPVPNPDFPFLGVHFTRMIGGGVEAGPNAVLAFRREGYTNRDVHWGELWQTLRFAGFRKVARKYWREGWEEMYRSFSKKAFVESLQKLVPEIRGEDLEPGGAGVRAQACDEHGNLIDDFLIFENEFVVNVCNAPSPAATASLSIGTTIADKVLKRF